MEGRIRARKDNWRGQNREATLSPKQFFDSAEARVETYAMTDNVTDEEFAKAVEAIGRPVRPVLPAGGRSGVLGHPAEPLDR
ncbi:MAG: hypothetical protein M5U32_11550 [Myxococcota bacterium]|nr:hypothetical protein [Myxococcota bacterium]